MKLNKKLLVFPYIFIILISIYSFIQIYPIFMYLLYKLAGYNGGIKVVHEIFRIIVFTLKNLLYGLIISMGIIVLIKHFNKLSYTST